MTATEVRLALRRLSDPQRAASASRFFKMGPGEYGAGDSFLGVKVPDQRRVARQFRGMPLSEALQLLKSPFHEERLTSVFLLVDLYQRSRRDPKIRESVIRAYLRHLKHINNWDIVDSSAPKLLGNWLIERDKADLYRLAQHKNLWHRRIAIVATQELIHHGQTADTYALAQIFLNDPEDLIHKATGWMLREAGSKVSPEELKAFLQSHAGEMPRTMLRYAIEKFSVPERKRWLSHHL